MVGFLVIFTAFFQWLSGFIIITWMTSVYPSKVSFTGGEEGSLSFQGSISRNVKQVFAIFRSGFHQAHFLMRTLKGKILHGALRQSILSEGAFSGTNRTVCQLEENKDESENLCQDKSRAKGLKTFQSF